LVPVVVDDRVLQHVPDRGLQQLVGTHHGRAGRRHRHRRPRERRLERLAESRDQFRQVDLRPRAVPVERDVDPRGLVAEVCQRLDLPIDDVEVVVALLVDMVSGGGSRIRR